MRKIIHAERTPVYTMPNLTCLEERGQQSQRAFAAVLSGPSIARGLSDEFGSLFSGRASIWLLRAGAHFVSSCWAP
jgi:hypothetical protein